MFVISQKHSIVNLNDISLSKTEMATRCEPHPVEVATQTRATRGHFLAHRLESGDYRAGRDLLRINVKLS